MKPAKCGNCGPKKCTVDEDKNVCTLDGSKGLFSVSPFPNPELKQLEFFLPLDTASLVCEIRCHLDCIYLHNSQVTHYYSHSTDGELELRDHDLPKITQVSQIQVSV